MNRIHLNIINSADIQISNLNFTQVIMFLDYNYLETQITQSLKYEYRE